MPPLPSPTNGEAVANTPVIFLAARFSEPRGWAGPHPEWNRRGEGGEEGEEEGGESRAQKGGERSEVEREGEGGRGMAAGACV